MANVAGNKIDVRFKALISQAVFDFFNDPDFGLELSAKAQKRLSSPRRGRTVSLEEIKKKYL